MLHLFPLLFTSIALASEEAAHGGAEAGIPWGPIAFHALNLGILLAVVIRFAGRSIRDAVRDRAARIRKDIDTSATLREDASRRYAELSARLDGFEAELSAMKVQAEQEAAREREEILARAARESKVIEEAATRTIRSEVTRARIELRQEAVRLSIRIAEARLRGQLRGEDEERYAADFLRAVKEVPNG